MIQCKLYARGGGSGGSQEREVANGADVVFTDTGDLIYKTNKQRCRPIYRRNIKTSAPVASDVTIA